MSYLYDRNQELEESRKNVQTWEESISMTSKIDAHIAEVKADILAIRSKQ
jgi:hypothetical protein